MKRGKLTIVIRRGRPGSSSIGKLPSLASSKSKNEYMSFESSMMDKEWYVFGEE